MTGTTPEVAPDNWTLHDNRWATLTIDGTAYRVRPPRLGELRLFDGAVAAASDHVQEAAETAQKRASELDEEVAAGTMIRSTATIEAARLARDFEKFSQEAWFDVLRMVIENLCDRPLPDEALWPVWFPATGAAQLAHLNQLWKLLPPPSGVSLR